MSSIFEPPLRPQTRSSRKRKRSIPQDEDGDHVAEEGDQSDGDPAAAPKRHDTNTSASHVTDDRNTQKTEHPANPSRRHNDLRYQHFTVLNTALFTCLEKSDYTRASRIFGMLIRFEPPGQSYGTHIDLRKNNLWGVGAEILLRRDPPSDLGVHETDGQAPIASDLGFENAKAFYERLILQFPTRITRSQTIASEIQKRDLPLHRIQSPNALHFYPVLMSLWIHQIDARNRHRMERIHALQNPRPVSEVDDSSAPVDAQYEIEELSDACVNDVNAIIERFEEITHVAPYYLDPKLARMKADVLAWMGDVVAAVGRDGEIEKWKGLAGKSREKAAEMRSGLEVT